MLEQGEMWPAWVRGFTVAQEYWVKPGMGNEEIGNEKWKLEMGNGDVRKGLDCTHHSLIMGSR